MKQSLISFSSCKTFLLSGLFHGKSDFGCMVVGILFEFMKSENIENIYRS